MLSWFLCSSFFTAMPLLPFLVTAKTNPVCGKQRPLSCQCSRNSGGPFCAMHCHCIAGGRISSVGFVPWKTVALFCPSKSCCLASRSREAVEALSRVCPETPLHRKRGSAVRRHTLWPCSIHDADGSMATRQLISTSA